MCASDSTQTEFSFCPEIVEFANFHTNTNRITNEPPLKLNLHCLDRAKKGIWGKLTFSEKAGHGC